MTEHFCSQFGGALALCSKSQQLPGTVLFDRVSLQLCRALRCDWAPALAAVEGQLAIGQNCTTRQTPEQDSASLQHRQASERAAATVCRGEQHTS